MSQSYVPEKFVTARLVLRAPVNGDGTVVHQAIMDSFDALTVWMPWAATRQSPAETESFIRESAAKFRARDELNYLIHRRQPDDAPGAFVGLVGLHHIDWSVPCFEFGYWLTTAQAGHGYMTEAVTTISTYCIDHLKAERLEIRCDARNQASAAVAVRAGFSLEATLRRNGRANDGSLRDTQIYVRLRG